MVYYYNLINIRCHGFRSTFLNDFARGTIAYDKNGKVVFAAAGLGVVLDKKAGFLA
jgi:hypothetical protein